MRQPWDTFEKHDNQWLRRRSATHPQHAEHSHALIIVGAGLAGCWLARILAERGISIRLIDQHQQVGCEASGNPAGIVKPFVTRAPCEAMSFHVAAHQYLLEQLRLMNLQAAANFQTCGVLQLVNARYPASGVYHSLCTSESDTVAKHHLGCPALHFPRSGWLNPQRLCRALAAHPLITQTLGSQVTGLQKGRISGASSSGPAYWCVNMDDQSQFTAPQLVLALGSSLRKLPQMSGACLIPARGQISRFALARKATNVATVISGKHYIIPDGDSILVGATFDRGNADNAVTEADHQINLAGLKLTLPGLAVNPDALAGYAGVRATTPDRLPLVGPVPDWFQAQKVYRGLEHGKPSSHYPTLPCMAGLSVLGGFGSRGIVTAPLSARLLADFLVGVESGYSSPVDGNASPTALKSLHHWAPLLNPVRFLIRDLKRGIVHSRERRYN